MFFICILTCRPICESVISPSSSARGTNAATESTTTAAHGEGNEKVNRHGSADKFDSINMPAMRTLVVYHGIIYLPTSTADERTSWSTTSKAISPESGWNDRPSDDTSRQGIYQKEHEAASTQNEPWHNEPLIRFCMSLRCEPGIRGECQRLHQGSSRRLDQKKREQQSSMTS